MPPFKPEIDDNNLAKRFNFITDAKATERRLRNTLIKKDVMDMVKENPAFDDFELGKKKKKAKAHSGFAKTFI